MTISWKTYINDLFFINWEGALTVVEVWLIKWYFFQVDWNLLIAYRSLQRWIRDRQKNKPIPQRSSLVVFKIYYNRQRLYFTYQLDVLCIFLGSHPLKLVNYPITPHSPTWTYLKGRNFRGKKISRILTKFAKINSFLTPENVDSRKLSPAKFFKSGDLRKLIPAKFFKN